MAKISTGVATGSSATVASPLVTTTGPLAAATAFDAGPASGGGATTISLNPEQIAELLVKTITAEIVLILEPLKMTQQRAALDAVVPRRDQLSFVVATTGGSREPRLKKFLQTSGTDVDGNYFCFGCCGFYKPNATCVDHVYPIAEALKNLSAFLEYLNKHLEIANAFLRSETIRYYFVRDKSDGQIKAKRYLSEVMYNNEANAWVLCQSCNQAKSDDTKLTAFNKNRLHAIFLGERLIEAIKQEGGLQNGILINRIIGGTVPNLTIGTRTVYLHGEVSSTGLGDFIRKWVKAEERERVFEALKKHQASVKATKNSLAEASSSKKAIKQQVRTVEQLSQFVQTVISKKPIAFEGDLELSSGQSDNEGFGAAMLEETDRLRALEHIQKQIERNIRKHFSVSGSTQGQAENDLGRRIKTEIMQLLDISKLQLNEMLALETYIEDELFGDNIKPAAEQLDYLKQKIVGYIAEKTEVNKRQGEAAAADAQARKMLEERRHRPRKRKQLAEEKEDTPVSCDSAADTNLREALEPVPEEDPSQSETSSSAAATPPGSGL